MSYLFYKALHIVGFVSWFAGLFYLVRLFIYHVEANERPPTERAVLHAQFVIMERRLFVAIVVPAMAITLIFGGLMAVTYLQAAAGRTSIAWLLVKLCFVALLIVYQQICDGVRRQLDAGTCRWTSAELRLWNEVATLLLVAIVLLAVFKSLFDALWGTVGLIAFGLLLAMAVRLMRKRWKKAAPSTPTA